MIAFLRDLRYGARALRANAGFTLAAAATIAIAVGATAAMFSIIQPVLLQPLPFAQPDRLVAIETFRLDTCLAMISMIAPGEKPGPEVAALYDRALDEVRRVPGVQSAAAASAGPFFGGVEMVDVRPEGNSTSDPADPARYFNIAPGFFKTMGVPLHSGREFMVEDRRGSPMVAIVNDAFARRVLKGRDAIGALVTLGRGGDIVSVVGVVGDVVQDLRSRTPSGPEIYYPYAQQTRWAAYVTVRSDNLAITLPVVGNRLRATDPSLRVGSPIVMAESMARATRGPRFTMLLLGGFALVALLLSAIGVYGLVSYSTAQRTREIGLRLSLGAGRGDILALLARNGILAIVVGSAAGIAGTIAINRLLASALPLMEPLGPASVLFSWAVLVSAGILACYIPARRALGIDPSAALRST